jgi:hypothetical protein
MIRNLLRRADVLLALALFVSVASLARGQQYQADPVDENAGKLRPFADQVVRTPGRFATDRERFMEFFEKYYFPAMTRYAPQDLGQLGRMRDDLFARFLRASTDENLQRELTALALKKAWAVAPSSKYHPAVRYNAVLILGMLDDSYAAPGRPAVPSQEAAKNLVTIVSFAADGKRVPPFLVVGALVGLQRQALLHDSLKKETADSIAAAVLKLATKDEPLPEVEPKVAEWMRIQAATVLANLGSPGAKGEVLAVLTKMISGATEPKMSLDARVQIAALLKQLNFAGATVDGKAMADALLQLSLDVADDEAKESQAFEDLLVQSGGMGAGYGTTQRNKTRVKVNLETQALEYNASILLARLTDLKAGLSAFKANAPADKQTVIDAVIASVNPVLAAASSTDTLDLALAEKVGAMATQIRAAVKPGTAPPASNDPADLL